MAVESKVTAKLILNRREAEIWSRRFLGGNTRRISAELVQATRVEAPVRTGWLRSNIQPAPIRFTGPFKVEGGVEIDLAAVPYAKFVRDGTRPHVIRARPGGYLRFYSRGRTIFAKQVNHPGTKPNFFMERAVQRVARSIRWT